MSDTRSDPLDELGQALQCVSKLASRPDVLERIGLSQAQEFRTATVGFRQRFPHHWPDDQLQLPIGAE